MTPAARIAAAAALLDEILAGTPAEAALTGWARRSRFAGSKDRAAVRDHVYDALRCRRSYAARGGAETGRGLMIGAIRVADMPPSDLFTGDGHAPPPLSAAESAAGRAPADGAESADIPDWLWPRLQASLQADAMDTAYRLRERAPVMLRVNPRRGPVQETLESLAEDGVSAAPATIAPLALKVTAGARRVAASRAYKSGRVELQDGSSQAAMAALDVPADGRVLDYCAGGGGKVLALAAAADATWHAHDAHPRRMKDLPERARRAGVRVSQMATSDLQPRSYDLVLCDVPCSGSGTWRRTPDAKWRLTPAALAKLVETQRSILSQAAGLVAPGGMLAYCTCSIVEEENEAQVAEFVSDAPRWHVLCERRWPVSDAGDGFFLSVLIDN